MQTLLKSRLDGRRQTFALHAAFAGVAVLVLVYLATAFCFAMMQSVSELRAGAQALAAGDLRARIAMQDKSMANVTSVEGVYDSSIEKLDLKMKCSISRNTRWRSTSSTQSGSSSTSSSTTTR